MELKTVDPRALKPNPNRSRQTKATAQEDAQLLATIREVGVLEPPIVVPEANGGNGYIIEFGHRRVEQAIAAGLEEIKVLYVDSAFDNGAMRSFIENVARAQLNSVDQWRAIERLVAQNWTEEAIASALAIPLRRVTHLRHFASVLPGMLDQMARGDMPNEQQLRTIAAAATSEQKEVWKKYKPSKADPKVDWWRVAQALTKKRMYAKDASFGDDLREAYGIAWTVDIFAPADEDGRYTTDVDAYLGAQQEWMTNNLPKKGVVAEINSWGQPELPKKAERIHGKPSKSDHTALYLDRDGRVQSVHYRMPEAKKARGGAGEATGETVIVSRPRPDVTRKGEEMIGDLRTDALHDALGRAPIEDDTLMALLVLAFAGENVRVDSGAGGHFYGSLRMGRHAASLFDHEGKLAFDADTLRLAVRGVLIDVLSCRENSTRTGILARVAGDAIGADNFLATMGTEEFLSCLSRPALEASCKDTPIQPRQRVKDTRAALVEHFKEGHFVHPAALFAPKDAQIVAWAAKNTVVEDDAEDEVADVTDEAIVDPVDDEGSGEYAEGFREAAE